MDLATTLRGLNRTEAGIVNRVLERSSGRLERLLDGPTTLRVVVESAQPEYRATLSLNIPGASLTSEGNGHELATVLAGACEKLRGQMVRARHRRESQRHRAVLRPAQT